MPPKKKGVVKRIGEGKGTPQRRSRWGILINTNYKPLDNTDQAQQENALYNALEEVFSDYWEEILKWRKGYHPELIMGDPKTAIRTELGSDPRGMRIHAHAEFQIKHKTSLQIDYSKLRMVLDQVFLRHGVKAPGLFLRVKLEHNDQDALRIYQEKKAKFIDDLIVEARGR